MGDSAKRWLAFAFFIAAVIVHHAFVYLGVYTGDDISYERYAMYATSAGYNPFDATEHLVQHRWMVIYITAFFYKLFGINEITSSASGLICVFSIGYLIKLILKKEPFHVYVLALLLYFLNYHTFFSTHKMFADSPVALFGFLTFYMYQRASAAGSKKNLLYAVCFSVSAFCIMLSKETVVLFLPLYLIFLIRDLWSKRMTKFWIEAIVVAAFLLFLYLLAFKIATGDWFSRFHRLRIQGYPCNFDLLPFVETLKRIGYLLWDAFLLNGDLIVYLFGVCGFIYRNKIKQPPQMKEFGLACVILLLTSNFMSYSLTSYVPLCQDPRHFIFIVPFAAISGAYLLRDYFEQPAKYPLLIVSFALATFAIFAVGGGEMKYIYLLVLLGLIFIYLARVFKWRRLNFSLCFAFFLVCFAIRPFYDLIHNKFEYYWDHKKLVKTTFPKEIGSGTVYSGDIVMKEINEYFLDFHTGDVHFKYIQQYKKGAAPSPNTYLLVNGAYRPPVRAAVDLLIQRQPSSLKLLKQYGHISLYRVEDDSALDSLAQSLMLRH